MLWKIATKFDKGQTVYVLDEKNQCIHFNKKIDNIQIIIGKDYFKIEYKVYGLKEYYREMCVFKKLEEAEQRLKQLYCIKEEENEDIS